MIETGLPVFDLFAFAVDCDLSITEGRLLTRDLITCVLNWCKKYISIKMECIVRPKVGHGTLKSKV